MDEPLSNLDAKLRVQTRTQIAVAAAPPRRHHRLRHPRPGRGHDDGRPGRGAQGRPAAAGRHPARAVRQPGQRLRRRLHRLARDEPARAARRRRRRRSSAAHVVPRAARACWRAAPATHGHRRLPARGPRGSSARPAASPVEVDVVEELGADAYVYGAPAGDVDRPDGRHDDRSSPAPTAAAPRRRARPSTSRPSRATCTCSTPPASASATDRPRARRDSPRGPSRAVPATAAPFDRTVCSMDPWPCRSPLPPDPACSTCPWDTPLEDWPAEHWSRSRAASPGTSCASSGFRRRRLRGQGDRPSTLAQREYRLLRQLDRLDVPVRRARRRRHRPRRPRRRAARPGAGHPAPAVLAALPGAVLLDAAPGHGRPGSRRPGRCCSCGCTSAGFYWGDCSLSNTLFRRDAGAFAAYLVDAETGELHPHALDRAARVRPGDRPRQHRRRADGPARPAACSHETIGPLRTSASSSSSATGGCGTSCTGRESFERGERWRVDARIRRLNELGFDVGELTIVTDLDGTTVQHPAEGRRRRPPHRAGCCA